jgi:hypothetical protein
MGDSDGGDFQYILDAKCDGPRGDSEDDMLWDIGIIQGDSGEDEESKIGGEFDDNFVGGSDNDGDGYANQEERSVRDEEKEDKQNKRKLNNNLKVQHRI